MNRDRNWMAWVVAVAVALGLAAVVAFGLRRESPGAARTEVVVGDPIKVAASPTPVPAAAVANAVPEAPTTESSAHVEPPPQSIRFFGTVCDAADGNPIAGAEIVRCERFLGTFRPAGVAATTGKDGRYEFELDRDSQRHTVHVARAPGYTTMGPAARHLLDTEPGSDSRRLDYELFANAGSIVLVILDESGAPVADALAGGISLRPVSASKLSAPYAAKAYCSLGVSDAAGRVALDGLPLAESFRIPVEKPGFLKTTSDEIAVGAEATVELRRSEASVHGKVLTADDRPVSNAIVRLRPGEAADFDELESAAARAYATSDENGAFAFADLSAGSYVTGFSDKCDSASSPCVEFDLEVGEDREVILRLPPASQVTGRVYDVATGKGVEGALLWGYPIGGTRSLSELNAVPADAVRSGKDGTFRLSVQARFDGDGSIGFRLPDGWVPVDESFPAAIYLQNLAGRDSLVRDLRVEAGVSLSGVVLRADERTPVRDAKVRGRAVDHGPGSTNFSAEATASADGTFSMAVPPGRTIELSTTFGRSHAEQAVAIPPDGEPEAARLVLQEYASVTGCVRAGGKPVEGVMVGCVDDSGRVNWGGFLDRAVTRSNGFYEILAVKAGNVRIGLSPQGAAARNFRMPEPKGVTLAPGERGAVDFDLDWGSVIEGVVTEFDGPPIKDAYVSLGIRDPENGIGEGRFSARSDAEGYYAIGGLDGTEALAYVRVSTAGYFPESRPIASLEESPVNFAMRRNHPIPLLVCAGGESAPVASYSYTITGRGSEGTRWSYSPSEPVEVRSADGRTQLTDVGRGNHRLEVREIASASAATAGTPPRSAMLDFSVDPEVPPAPLVVDLGSGVPVAGRVVATGTGTPVAGARIALLPPRTSLQRSTKFPSSPWTAISDSAGAFAIQAVTPGRYDLGVWTTGFLKAIAVDIPADGLAEELEIAVLLAGELEVRVVVDDDVLFREARAAYEIRPQEPSSPQDRNESMHGTLDFDEQGIARVVGVPVGEMTIEVELPDGRTGSAGFHLSEAVPHSSVHVDLRAEIEVTGMVAINGEPWEGSPKLSLMYRNVALEALGGGRYRMKARAGGYCLAAATPNGVWSLREIRVPGDAPTCVVDVALDLAEVTIIVEPPDGVEIPNGSVSLQWPEMALGCAPWRTGTLRGPSALVEWVVAGEYVARFESSDFLWKGSSEPGEVAANRENVFVVPIERSSQVRQIGSWDTSDMSPGANRISIAASRTGGTGISSFTLVFEQTGGSGSIKLLRATVQQSTGSKTFDLFRTVSPNQPTAVVQPEIDPFALIGDFTLVLEVEKTTDAPCAGSVYIDIR